MLNPPALSSVSMTSPTIYNYPSFNFSLGLCVQTNIRQHSFQAGQSMPWDSRWQIQLTICPAFSMTRHVCGQSRIPEILQKVMFCFWTFSLKSSKKDFCDSNKRAQIRAGLSSLQWKRVEDRTYARSSEHTQPPLSAIPSQHWSFRSRSSFILLSDWPSTCLSVSQDWIKEIAATSHERDAKMAGTCSKWPLGTTPLITLYVFSLPLLHVVLALRGMSCSLKSEQKTQTT